MSIARPDHHPVQAQDFNFDDYSNAAARKGIDRRVEEILSMPAEDISSRLIGLVALSHDTEEPPLRLVRAIEESAEIIIDEFDDDDYTIGEVVALVDAALVTGKQKLADKALEIVSEDHDADVSRFTPATQTIVQIAHNEGIEYHKAYRESLERNPASEIVTPIKEPSVEDSPLGPEYDWLFKN